MAVREPPSVHGFLLAVLTSDVMWRLRYPDRPLNGRCTAPCKRCALSGWGEMLRLSEAVFVRSPVFREGRAVGRSQ